MKNCSKCNQEKELTEFPKRAKGTGYGSWCKSCVREYKATYYIEAGKQRAKERLEDEEYRQRSNGNQRDRYQRDPVSRMWHQAKHSAKRNGLEFDIEKEDILLIPECPIFKVPFTHRGRFAHSLDRIDNSQGYVKGNIWVISRLANTMKNDATLEELRAFCEGVLSTIC